MPEAPVPERRKSVPKSPAVDALAAKRKNSINLLWEVTQTFLALLLVVSVVILAILQRTIDESLKSAMFLVIGFYFGRTNHSRPTPTQPFGGSTVAGVE